MFVRSLNATMDDLNNSDITDILNKTQSDEDENFFGGNRFAVLSGNSGSNGGQVKSTSDQGVHDDGWRVNKAKRKRGQNGSVDIDTFGNMGHDDKLNVLFQKISNVEKSQQDVKTMNENLQNTTTRVSNLESRVQTNTDIITKLSYKLLQMDTRNRSRNLIIYGLRDNDGRVYDQVSDFLYDNLDIDSSEIDIEFASKFGQSRDHNYRPRKRATVVTFQHTDQVDYCLRRAFKLAGTSYAIDRDYPQEIQQARKRLWPEFKRLRTEHRSAAKLIFPAAIKVGSTIVRDEFPDWDRLVNGRVSPNTTPITGVANSVNSAPIRPHDTPPITTVTYPATSTSQPTSHVNTGASVMMTPAPVDVTLCATQSSTQSTQTANIDVEDRTQFSQPTSSSRSRPVKNKQNNQPKVNPAVKSNTRARSVSTNRVSRPRGRQPQPSTNQRQKSSANLRSQSDDRTVGGARSADDSV